MEIACLRIERGPMEGRAFSLRDLTVFEVGRARGCHVRLGDPDVASNQLRLCRRGEGFTLYSLSDRVPVRVNGEVVEKAELRPGDRIEVGQTVLRFERADEADLAGARPASTAPALEDEASARSRGRLVVLSGEDRGRVFPIDPSGPVRIGRSPDVEIRLADGKISREHCRIECGEEGAVIADLGSANGTVVNGRRVTREMLRPGDYVRLGLTVLAYRERE